MLAAASNVYFAPKNRVNAPDITNFITIKKTLHEIVFDFSKITYIFARFSYHFKKSGVCSLIEKKVWSKKYKFDFIKSLKTRCHIIELIFKAKQIDNGVIQPSTLYKPRIHKCLICYQLWYNFFLRSIDIFSPSIFTKYLRYIMKSIEMSWKHSQKKNLIKMISSHCGWHFRPKILQRIILQYANKFLIQTNICIAQHIVLLYTVCALMLYNFKGWMQALGPKSLYIVNIFFIWHFKFHQCNLSNSVLFMGSAPDWIGKKVNEVPLMNLSHVQLSWQGKEVQLQGLAPFAYP